MGQSKDTESPLLERRDNREEASGSSWVTELRPQKLSRRNFCKFPILVIFLLKISLQILHIYIYIYACHIRIYNGPLKQRTHLPTILHRVTQHTGTLASQTQLCSTYNPQDKNSVDLDSPGQSFNIGHPEVFLGWRIGGSHELEATPPPGLSFCLCLSDLIR